MLAGEGDERGQVCDSLPFEQRELVGKVTDSVGQAVGQRGLAESTVPPAGAEADRFLLEDDDPQGWVRVGQGDGGP